MLGRVIGGQPPVVAREDARAEGQKCRGYFGSRFVRFNNYVPAKSWIDIEIGACGARDGSLSGARRAAKASQICHSQR